VVLSLGYRPDLQHRLWRPEVCLPSLSRASMMAISQHYELKQENKEISIYRFKDGG
jgi:hypothetical protein